MRIRRILFWVAIVALVGCTTAQHSDDCTEVCLSGSDAQALAHLTARLEANRLELETVENPARRYVILEIISGIEAHIDYIKAGRPRK